MARARDPARADAVARWLVPAAFDEAAPGRPASWSPRGAAFFEARHALLAIVLGGPPVPLAPHADGDRATPATECLWSRAGAGRASALLAALGVLGALGVARRRRRRGRR
jgi:hypothetical protein